MVSNFLERNMATLLFICVLLFYQLSYAGERMSVAFLSVDQGDATLITTGQGVQILIDGGPGGQVLREVAKYMPPWDREIEIVVLTHPHDDHIAGIVDVLESFDVGEVWIGSECLESQLYTYLLENHERVVVVKQGDRFEIDQISLEILNPISQPSRPRCGAVNLNNESVVILVKSPDKSVLLMGDAEAEIEARLIPVLRNEEIDILKAGHHCSKTSNTDAFIKTVLPRKIICSCGEDNKFGHPSKSVIERFDLLKTPYFLTYQSGSIEFEL